MKHKHNITMQNTKIYFETYGKGMPILIIHGWGIDHRTMTGSMEHVFHGNNRSFQRIYIDLPGMGKSEANPNIKTADDVLSVLLEFIKIVINDRDFLVVGESWGGSFARALLHFHLERIMGICLLCTTSLSNVKDIAIPGFTVIQKDDDLLNTLSQNERQIFTSVAVMQTKRVWKIFKRDVYPALSKRNTEYLTKTLSGRFISDSCTEMLMFDKPVLVVSGKQDHKVGYQDQTDMFLNYPRATVVVLDHAGHCLQIEQQEVFQALVFDWLNRVKSDI